VLCLLAAGTANAAKISFSDKGFVDVGALIQAQYRIEQNLASSGSDPSNDFLLSRARILLSGQFNDMIGFIIDTDVTYGAAIIGGPAGQPSGAATSPSTYNLGSGAGWSNNIYLLDALGTLKVAREFILDTGLMLLPYSHNSLTSGAKYASVNRFFANFSPNSQRGLRDVGVLIRGLLLDDRIYYRMGVFNGVQTTKNTAVAPAASNGVNPGDAPRFAGMLRFNILGKEDGYSFCQVCFGTSPLLNIGVSADYQANAIRPTLATAPTPPATAAVITPQHMHSWTTLNADIFANFPFSADLELSAEFLFSKYFVGDNTVQSGQEYQGLLAMRFGVFGIFGAIDYFNSETQFVGPGATTGDYKYYRAGLNYYLLQNIYKITAEIAFQDRENAGLKAANGTTVITDNHWVGTLQFQVGF
jgi:hypothetical protein